MTFLEFVSQKEKLNDVKEIIMNFLGATEGALDSELSDFKKYNELLNSEKNPEFNKMIKDSKNNASIISAIKNAGSTKISIADLIALFASEEEE